MSLHRPPQKNLAVRVLGGAALLGAVIALASAVPQMRRYLRIKRM